MTERKRDRPLYVMLDAEDDAMFRARAAQLGLSLREFVTRALTSYQNPRSLEARIEELERKTGTLV